jgi:hypothetical protein
VEIRTRVQGSTEVMLWVAQRLDGYKLRGLPTSKRQAIVAGAWHVAVEHDQAIVLLVQERLYGSALALVRVLFEAYLRGLWLLYAATDAKVEDAGRDRFPDATTMVTDLEAKGLSLTKVKSESWRRLCSYTHTGYQQIGARLTTSGLGSDYPDDEVIQALTWADTVVLNTVIQFAVLGDDEPLAREALARLKANDQPEEVEAGA